MSSKKAPLGGYGSAEDLPTFKEMRTSLSAMMLAKLLLPKEKRGQVAELKGQIDRMSRLVDAFYAKLGPRHWLYDEQLPMTDIEELVELNVDDAESRLVALYRDSSYLGRRVLGLRSRPELSARLRLVELARTDYDADRFHSVVLTLVTVMDGFVNDTDKATRKGLHARDSDEMNPWDSVIGHHMGLARVHREVFTRTFKKTQVEPVYEVYRNGILHGVLLNYDNLIVATKCWNMLFALDAWARAENTASQPEPEKMSVSSTMRRVTATERWRERQEAWAPHEHDVLPEDDDELAVTVRSFLENWERGRWGLVGTALHTGATTTPSASELVEIAKGAFALLPLAKWTLRRRRHVASAVAVVDAELVVGDVAREVELRWLHVTEGGVPASEWEHGRWLLTMYPPTDLFIRHSDQ